MIVTDPDKAEQNNVPEKCPECGEEWIGVLQKTSRGDELFYPVEKTCEPSSGYKDSDWRALVFLHD